MQRTQDIGNLGFVRRQLPEREGPRQQGKTRKDPRPGNASNASNASNAASIASNAASIASNAASNANIAASIASNASIAAVMPAIVEGTLARESKEELRALGELSCTNTRVDQISMKLSVLDNAVKSSEKALAALREEHGSIAKSSGGQTAERVEALGRQLRALEESFCSFSARLDRQCKELAESAARLQSEGCRKEDALAAKVRACEDLCAALQGKLQVQDVADSVVQWLKREAIPDMKRTLAQADRSDILQAATMAAHESLLTEIKTAACAPETIHRCSLPLEAQVLRATHGKHVGDALLLHHPIVTIGETNYMHCVARGSNGAVDVELFPVEDAAGPLVAFVSK